jgi:hypothetical protein
LPARIVQVTTTCNPASSISCFFAIGLLLDGVEMTGKDESFVTVGTAVTREFVVYGVINTPVAAGAHVIQLLGGVENSSYPGVSGKAEWGPGVSPAVVVQVY